MTTPALAPSAAPVRPQPPQTRPAGQTAAAQAQASSAAVYQRDAYKPSAQARAATDDPSITNDSLTADGDALFEQADREMNVAYRALMQNLDAPAKALLVKAQRAWVAYRDAQANWDGDVARGGTAGSQLVTGTMTELTIARTKALRADLDQH